MEILLVLVVFGLLYFFWHKMKAVSPSAGTNKNQLFKKYCQLMRLPPNEAREQLNFQIQRLKAKHPGKSEEWYLDKIIYDLERDRG